ncbi:MAG: nuclease A inhibitor family protein [Pyrinomonadaceae bacterium]
MDGIEKATEGLIYVSETDAHVVAFAAAETTATPETILQHLGIDGDASVEEMSFEAFFDRLSTIKEWHGEREKAKAKKFLALKKLLEKDLRDLTVYRVGRVQIDIYVVGIDAEGRVIGVTTKAVET